ncbi:MAG TPA: 1,2-phenylacetyl-CoA epoxidase subunit PaaD [Candidatus Limnocylindria bacterium]|nr:1,2-phenylacetyl-CoA epoxidase subunit PaaD [Candidatus Limnocylindria bacterium]
MVTATGGAEARVWEALAEIADPEIPAISVVDLGVIGEVDIDADRVRVDLLPTFVGCPAIGVMRDLIQERLGTLRVAPRVEVRVTFDPPWTSARISPVGRERLRASGFAPPVAAPSVSGLDELTVLSSAECPYCGSRNTTMENAFGPTLCRSIHHCADCRQPFEQFKSI